MIALDDALRSVTLLGFDSAPFIYFVERNPAYLTTMREVFRRVTAGDFHGVTSSVTLTEVLVHPFARYDYKLAKSYRELLQNSVNFRTIAASNAIAERAARLRADYKLRTPDALQIATALECGCEAFLTNDAALTRVGELRVLALDDLMWTPTSPQAS